MALAPWSSPLPGFLPNQVTEFHPEGKCSFAALRQLCVMSTLTFCQNQNTRHNPWQAPMFFQRLEGKHVKLEHFWKFWDVQTQFHREMILERKHHHHRRSSHELHKPLFWVHLGFY